MNRENILIHPIDSFNRANTMPTNLPAVAKKKWNEVSLARTSQEKLEKLQEFLNLVPMKEGILIKPAEKAPRLRGLPAKLKVDPLECEAILAEAERKPNERRCIISVWLVKLEIWMLFCVPFY